MIAWELLRRKREWAFSAFAAVAWPTAGLRGGRACWVQTALPTCTSCTPICATFSLHTLPTASIVEKATSSFHYNPFFLFVPHPTRADQASVDCICPTPPTKA